MDNDALFTEHDLIHAYTREQAITDGTLVDVTDTAREAGFAIPVALTAALHADVTDLSGKHAAGQDTAGRLWDLLWLARLNATRPENAATSEFRFELHMPVGDRRRYEARCVIGPGDDGEPSITLMKSHED